MPDKKTFFEQCKLEPALPTLLFAGSTFEFHYFEILEILRLMRDQGKRYNLIMRIYPNKALLSSAFIIPLAAYAHTLPDVYISIGDPHYKSGSTELEVLQIEEKILWNSLKYCDAVVNLYSTISLEACIFDKPVINMWYFASQTNRVITPPVYVDYPRYRHNQRLASYGAVETTNSRTDLINLIDQRLYQPNGPSPSRRKTVEQECGPLDGKACERLVSACASAPRAKH